MTADPDRRGPRPDSPAGHEASAPGADKPRVITSEDLLAGQSSIRILHDGEAYSLRLTRNNRLILTK